MNKLFSILALFRKGQSVLDPALWKNRQIKVTVLSGVILAVVNVIAAFGMSIPVDIEMANTIAAGIITVVNIILTMTTSEKVGFAEKKDEVSVINTDNTP